MMENSFLGPSSNVAKGLCFIRDKMEPSIVYKYCDFSLKSDICLAKYDDGSFYLWIDNDEPKRHTKIPVIILLLKYARKKHLLVPKGLEYRLYKEIQNG